MSQCLKVNLCQNPTSPLFLLPGKIQAPCLVAPRLSPEVLWPWRTPWRRKGLCGRDKGSRLPECTAGPLHRQVALLWRGLGEELWNPSSQIPFRKEELPLSWRKPDSHSLMTGLCNAHHCFSRYLNKKKVITEAKPQNHLEYVGHYCDRCNLGSSYWWLNSLGTVTR